MVAGVRVEGREQGNAGEAYQERFHEIKMKLRPKPKPHGGWMGSDYEGTQGHWQQVGDDMLN